MRREKIVTREETTIERTFRETIIYREISDDRSAIPQLPSKTATAVEKPGNGIFDRLEKKLTRVNVVVGLLLTILTTVGGILQYFYRILW